MRLPTTAGRCPTSCDPDCELNGWGCHENHDVPSHREHDPAACESRALTANILGLIDAGWFLQLGLCGVPDGQPPMWFAAIRRTGRPVDVTFTGASVAEAAGKAAEWARRAGSENGGPAGDHRVCLCLCGVAHPGRDGICEAFRVVGTRRAITSSGVRDVPVCGPCALAVGTEPAPPRPGGGWTPENAGPEIRRLAELAQPLVIRLPPGTAEPDGGGG